MPLDVKYFVLKPRSKTKDDPHAIASRKAMNAYARSIYHHDPILCEQIHEWTQREKDLADALHD